MDNEKQASQVLENLLFPKIFRTFRMAIQPSKLIIAFLALAIICLVGWIMDFSRTVVTDKQGEITELQAYLENTHEIDAVSEFRKVCEKTGSRRGVFFTLWRFGSAKFHGALKSLFAFDLPGVAENIAEYFKAIRWAVTYHFLYCIIFFVVKLAVISVAGGAICRIAALQFAQDEKPGPIEAIRFSVKKFLSFFTAPLVPAGIIIFAGLCIFLLGLIGKIPLGIGELIMAIFTLLALTAGFVIAFFAIGTAVGFNLMFPAIAYEGSDCLDAMERSLTYVYKKPWHMGFYTAIAVVYGAICYIFVRFFALLLLLGTHGFLRFGIRIGSSAKDSDKLTAIWPEPSFMNLLGSSDLAGANWLGIFAAFVIRLFLWAIVGLVVSFIISFYFSANTIIYSLMRSGVDNTAPDDIYIHSEETQTEPATTESESEEPQSETHPDPSSTE